MIDLTCEFGKTAHRRLQDEEIIWLTTVTPAGVPQPNPVWFYWDGESIIIYSQPKSYRIRNIKNNPSVTLNLQGVDVLGQNVVILHGDAQLNPHYQKPHPGYEQKYIRYLPDINLTSEQMVAEYSVEIIIKPAKLRG